MFLLKKDEGGAKAPEGVSNECDKAICSKIGPGGGRLAAASAAAKWAWDSPRCRITHIYLGRRLDSTQFHPNWHLSGPPRAVRMRDSVRVVTIVRPGLGGRTLDQARSICLYWTQLGSGDDLPGPPSIRLGFEPESRT